MNSKIDGELALWAVPRVVNEQRDPWLWDEQQALMPWLRAHGVAPSQVPVDTPFVFVDGTCSVLMFRHDCGKIVLVDDSVVQDTVTFDVHDPFPLATP